MGFEDQHKTVFDINENYVSGHIVQISEVLGISYFLEVPLSNNMSCIFEIN